MSTLVNILASMVVAWLLLAWQGGFGGGDIVSFFFWTLPLALVVAAAGPVGVRLAERVPAGGRWVLLVAVACLSAFGWLAVVRWAQGPWERAFSFSLLYPWLVGVAAQLFFQHRYLVRTSEKALSWRHVLLNFLLLPGGLLVLLGGLWLRSYLTEPTPETYLIPASFRGTMRVAYKEKGGINPPVENGRLVLTIPPDGILLIQPEFRSGPVDVEFYLVDKAGRRERLFDGTQAGEPSKLRPFVRTEGIKGVAGELPDGSYSSDSPLAITYAVYTVFDPTAPAEAEAVLARRQEQQDSLMMVRIERSRLPQ